MPSISSSGLLHTNADLFLRFDFVGPDFGGESFFCPDGKEDFDVFFVLDGTNTGKTSHIAPAFLRNCFLDAGISLEADGEEVSGRVRLARVES